MPGAFDTFEYIGNEYDEFCEAVLASFSSTELVVIVEAKPLSNKTTCNKQSITRLSFTMPRTPC